MNVGDEQAEINRARPEFIFEGQAELANPGTGI
jgi:hypothetical protein